MPGPEVYFFSEQPWWLGEPWWLKHFTSNTSVLPEKEIKIYEIHWKSKSIVVVEEMQAYSSTQSNSFQLNVNFRSLNIMLMTNNVSPEIQHFITVVVFCSIHSAYFSLVFSSNNQKRCCNGGLIHHHIIKGVNEQQYILQY